jgi:hypothetical protein
MSINFLPRKWEGYYAYSSIVGRKYFPPTIERNIPLFLGLRIYTGLVHDKFFLLLYYR